MRVGVLGPAQARRGDAPVDLGTRKQRALVAVLALHDGQPVSVDAIVEALWPDRAPAGVNGTLQAYVAGLRRSLEPDRAARAPSSILVTVGAGYALRLNGDGLDAREFDAVVNRAHRLLAPLASVAAPGVMSQDDLSEATADLERALGMWRGLPYLELDDAPAAMAERTRLEEMRLLALEDRAVAGLALGQHATVAAELEALTSVHPLRERLWALRAIALTRSGRQADALDVLRQVREVLDDELGLEPGLELRELQTAVLRQDPLLAWTPATPSPPPPSPPAVAADPPLPRPSSPEVTLPAQPLRYLPAMPPWPLVGRSGELDALTDLLDTADAAVPSFAALVGEPGIGKSRLAGEVARAAVARGARVLLGRCSQDDGAPPLWPWSSVLRGLGAELPEAVGHDGGSPFRAWDEIAQTIIRACEHETLLLILDDLHWADVASLRVLRLLCESISAGRLLVVATWRNHPEPTGALGDVAETLARRHALRLDLVGLSATEAGEVVEAVAEAIPSDTEAQALRHRTDGNPFFLVEYARLARERGDLSGLIAEHDPPSAVADVLVRRLQRLPDDTVAALRAAAVVGRSFDVPVTAAVAGTDELAVLDLMEPALEAGLVRDVGVDEFQFSHALVRDTIYSSLSLSRRARLHVRAAEAVQGRPGRETELARHWAEAGPAYAARAWLAAVAAAGVARRLHAYEEASGLLRQALERLPLDPEATDRDRFDLLMELTDAQRWAGDWAGLLSTIGKAIEVADAMGDVHLLGRAATASAIGALWQSSPHGEVNTDIVAALRRVLERLPPEDSPLRCRAMISLALEIYYGSSHEERLALVEEGLAMARRLGDRSLLLDSCQLAFVAMWSQSTSELRHAWITEAMELAEELRNERILAVTTTLRAILASELGRVDEMWEMITLARELSERLRLPYGLIVLDTLSLPWLAMAGRFDECEALMAHVVSLDQRMTLRQSEDAVAGALLSLRLWQGRAAEVLPVILVMEARTSLPVASAVVLYYLRSGQPEAARAHLAQHPIRLGHDDWFSMLTWGCAAEVALELGERDLAVTAYDLLAPYSGRLVSAGSGNAMGPVDAFLAMAASAVGERDLATRHADRAAELCLDWQIPLAAQWWRGQRDRHGF